MKKLLNKFGISDLKSLKAFILQFLKFGIVGLSNFLIHMSVYYILVLVGVFYIISYIIAFILATINSFYWNRKFVFKQTTGNKYKQLVKVFTVYSSTILLSTATLYVMVDIIGISELIAPILNIFITTPINFMLNKFWAFRDSGTKDPQSNVK